MKIFIYLSSAVMVKNFTYFEGVKAEVIDKLKNDPQHMFIGLNKFNPQVFYS
ncbi:MAG: hypothetical protein ABI045_03030 [Flavobacteriales bacterium]